MPWAIFNKNITKKKKKLRWLPLSKLIEIKTVVTEAKLSLNCNSGSLVILVEVKQTIDSISI